MAPKICRRTGKVSYRSRREAEVALELRNAEPNVKRAYTNREIAVYKCPLCPRWHLTSQEQRGQAAS